MKKTILVTILAAGLTSAMGTSALANDGPGTSVNYENGVKVYRTTPARPNYQAIATFKSLELQEQQIDNQARQDRARLNAETRLNRDRLELDRRIAFTNNQIFTNQGNRGYNNRRYNNRGFNNRFYGINGISRNSRVSRGFH